MSNQKEQIEKRSRAMPKLYRGHYRKAMRGRSMKAAITAQCLECVQWVRKEVELCTDTGCLLYPYRPYRPQKKVKTASTISQEASGEGFGAVESIK